MPSALIWLAEHMISMRGEAREFRAEAKGHITQYSVSIKPGHNLWTFLDIVIQLSELVWNTEYQHDGNVFKA